MKSQLIQNIKRGLILAGVITLAASPQLASAAIDVSDATSSITGDGKSAITAVGTALIGLAGVAVVFKWVKGAIFS